MVEEMARQLSMATRRELKDAIGERYQAATRRRERQQILSEFVRVTGYHRKHALRVLNQAPAPQSPRPRGRLYDEAVRQALTVLWEAGDRICGKRLRALIPVLIDAMERHGHLRLDAVVRIRLLGVSAATIDRLLGPEREAAGRARRRSLDRSLFDLNNALTICPAERGRRDVRSGDASPSLAGWRRLSRSWVA